MQNIDFLPSKYREHKSRQNNKLWWLSVVIGFGMLIGLAHVGQTAIRLSAERELRSVEPHYIAATAAKQSLESLRQRQWQAQSEAELIAYLQHPWPRTQIVSRLALLLPEAVVLKRVHIGRQSETGAARNSAPAVKTTASAASSTPVDDGTAAQRDLKQLRDEIDAQSTHVELEGTTTDITALHTYLNRLASERLFAQAELTSIESLHKEKSGQSRFLARLTVRPGYGQRGGMQGTPNGKQPAVAKEARIKPMAAPAQEKG